MKDCFDDLDAPITRVAGPNIPIPFSPPIEAFETPGVAHVVDAVRRVVTCRYFRSVKAPAPSSAWAIVAPSRTSTYS